MANYIQAIKSKLIGQRDIEISDLEVFLNNSVAIGDHADIGVEIEKKIQNIEGLDSQIDTIDRYFSKKPEQENES
tara:strand:- start:641 stop:865 length:225 start_codon:yes stop_codon:yes gene_type:complete